MSTQLNNQPPQKRSSVAGWITFFIAVVLVIIGMAALAGPGLIQTRSDTPYYALFAKYFSDLDTAWNSGQIKTEGIYENLKKKGEDAQAYDNAGDFEKALNELNALLNELNAQAGNQVMEPDAGTLIADIQAIIDALNAPAPTGEPDTATLTDVSPEGPTTTPLEITESPTAEPVIVTVTPTVPGGSPTWSPTPPSGLFSVDGYNIGCSYAEVTGHFGPDTPSVRATVNLASNLGVMLAQEVLSHTNSGTFLLVMTYPQQPEGTRLIVAVGEWDGTKYLNPATLQGFDCTGSAAGTGTLQPSIGIATDASPTFTPSPTPIVPLGPTPTFVYFPTIPPVASPTGGGHLDYWTITSTFVAAMGCGTDFSPVNAIMPSFLEFGPTNSLTALIAANKRWQMFPRSDGTNTYVGTYETADSVQKTTDVLTLAFSSNSSFEAREVVTIIQKANPGQCEVDYSWAGAK